jgi:glycosyltransferase involved in cell wall biosynthesis
MEGSSWGGSEELWFRVAKFSIEKQDNVLVNIKHWDVEHAKIKELRKLGAKIIERKSNNNHKAPIRFLNKIGKKIFGQKKSRQWNWIEQERPDHLIINLGGPHDFLCHPELVELINQNNFDYSIIQQFNFENIVYNTFNRKIVAQIYGNAIHSYFVSRRNLEITERSICKRLNNSNIISNPANLLNLNIIEYPIENSQVNFACVARLDCMFKGQDILLSVFSKDKWLNRNWKLNLYGDGKDLDYLRELVNFYNLSSRVVFHGHVENIENIWAVNHILILPSLAEGTPLSLIEAMICGRPSIVTDVGGNSDLIIDEINGFVIPSANVEQCDLVIEKAWNNQKKWPIYGLEARRIVLEKNNFDSFKYIYDNAVRKN